MSAGELAYVVAALLAVALIPSLPALGSISRAGPHSRAELVRQLWIGWGVWAFLVAWLFIGWSAATSVAA
jgi:hypothetical protein